MEIKSGGSPPKYIGNVREFHHNLILPALKASGPKSNNAAPSNVPAWLTGYSSVKYALQGDPNGWEAKSPARAHQVLNSSPMYDMLKILKKLNREEPKSFRLLENTVWKIRTGSTTAECRRHRGRAHGRQFERQRLQ